MNIIDVNTAYVTAQSERARFFPVSQEFLDTLGYTGQGKSCVLTYDIAGAASAPVDTSSSSLSPVASGSFSIALTGAAVPLNALDDATKLVRISFTGSGDVNITYDGSTPTSGVGGEIWFKGGILEVNPTIAASIQFIKATATNSSVYVTQFA